MDPGACAGERNPRAATSRSSRRRLSVWLNIGLLLAAGAGCVPGETRSGAVDATPLTPPDAGDAASGAPNATAGEPIAFHAAVALTTDEAAIEKYIAPFLPARCACAAEGGGWEKCPLAR